MKFNDHKNNKKWYNIEPMGQEMNNKMVAYNSNHSQHGKEEK